MIKIMENLLTTKANSLSKKGWRRRVNWRDESRTPTMGRISSFCHLKNSIVFSFLRNEKTKKEDFLIVIWKAFLKCVAKEWRALIELEVISVNWIWTSVNKKFREVEGVRDLSYGWTLTLPVFFLMRKEGKDIEGI